MKIGHGGGAIIQPKQSPVCADQRVFLHATLVSLLRPCAGLPLVRRNAACIALQGDARV